MRSLETRQQLQQVTLGHIIRLLCCRAAQERTCGAQTSAPSMPVCVAHVCLVHVYVFGALCSMCGLCVWCMYVCGMHEYSIVICVCGACMYMWFMCVCVQCVWFVCLWYIYVCVGFACGACIYMWFMCVCGMQVCCVYVSRLMAGFFLFHTLPYF